MPIFALASAYVCDGPQADLQFFRHEENLIAYLVESEDEGFEMQPDEAQAFVAEAKRATVGMPNYGTRRQVPGGQLVLRVLV